MACRMLYDAFSWLPKMILFSEKLMKGLGIPRPGPANFRTKNSLRLPCNRQVYCLFETVLSLCKVCHRNSPQNLISGFIQIVENGRCSYDTSATLTQTSAAFIQTSAVLTRTSAILTRTSAGLALHRPF